MTNRVGRFLSAIMMAGCLTGAVAPARGATLWYNGDPDGRDALANGLGAAPVPDALVYDNFVISGANWTITGAYSTDLMNYVGVTSAHWEIRSGVSAGNGETLIASGTTSATQTDLGYSLLGFEVYRVSTTSLNVTLGPGTYWLTIAPISPSTGGLPANVSEIATTSGANAVGKPAGNDGNSFATSAGFGWNFTPTTDNSVEGPGTWDYSMGVVGTASPIVPEPSSSLLLGIGGLAVAGLAEARRRRQGRVIRSA